MKGPTNSSARPNIRLLNVSATFESNPDTSTNTEFPYRASIQADGVSEYMSATVMFSQIQATSGNFATYCQTDEDVVYIYSKTDVGTITIPAVSCDLSVNYINVDNVPTEDSQAVITSGGVYSNCVRTADNQAIYGLKTFKNTPTIRDDFPQLYLDNVTDDYTTTYTDIDTKVYMAFRDVNYLAVAHLSNYVYNGGRGLSISAFDKSSGSVKESNLALVVPKSSTPYVSASYRTTNIGNNDVLTKGNMWASTSVTTTTSGAGIIQRYGKLVVVKIYGLSVTSTGQFQQSGITIPKPINHANCTLTSGTGTLIGTAYADAGWTTINFHAVSTGTAYGTMVYFTNDA